MIKYFCLGPYQVLLLLWIRVELEVVEIKGYSTFPKVPGLESHNQMV